MQVNPPSGRISRLEILVFTVILLLALFVRLPPLDRGLALDEMDTAFYAIKTSTIWQTMSSSISFNNHIGYSLAARFSQHIFGGSEWAFRLPALLYGLASLGIFWIFSRSLLGPAVAALATFLLAQSPVHIIWSITGRGYSGMIFFTLVSSYLYLRLLRRTPSLRAVAIYVAVGTLGIYTHLYSAFVIMMQFVYLVYLYIRQGGKNSDRPVSSASFGWLLTSLIAVAALSLIIYTPALSSLFHDWMVRGRSNFVPTFPWAVIEYLSGSGGAPLAVAILLVSVLGMFSLSESHSLEVGYSVLLLTAPLGLMWLIRPFDLYPRFFATGCPTIYSSS